MAILTSDKIDLQMKNIIIDNDHFKMIKEWIYHEDINEKSKLLNQKLTL